MTIDIIGKRKYGYILSAIMVSVSLIFILATLIPNGNVGLQFSIAYTGGTVWEIGFEDGTPDPADVRAILEEQGLPNSEVAITGSDTRDYVLIRTEALSLQESTLAEGSAAAAVAAEEATAEEAAASSPSAEPENDPSTAPAIIADPSSEPLASPNADASAAPDASPDLAAAVATIDAESDAGAARSVPTEGEFGELAAALQAEFGAIDEVRQENSVGPVVSAELIQQTFLLILIASVAIMIWVSYRFRDFRMGVTAIVALLHDVTIVLGVFAILGTFFSIRIDALFVTAMLTVIGYSVHDTIVVFDRIRENRQRYLGEPLTQVVNFSLVQTLGRSLTTSLTLVLTLVALLLFGGEAIRSFTLALLIGVIAGTYSSIFVATPLYLDWHRWDDRRKADKPADAKAEAKASAA